MLFGLLVSPISWTHHWVWMLPLTMWLVLGSMRTRTRAVGWAWVALAYLGPPWVVTFTSHGDRPWYALVGGSLYVVATLATLAYVAAVSRRSD